MAGISTACAGRATRGPNWSRGAAVALVLAAGLSLGACSVPRWANPMDWFGDDEPAPAATAPGSANSPAATSDRFPNLGRVPPRPVEVTSEGERRRALDNLAADRENARHTDQELRARPADSNTPPPAPRAPVTPMPGASFDPGPQPAQSAQPRQQLAPSQPAQRPMQVAQQAQPSQGGAQQPVTLQPPAPTAVAQNQGRAPAPTGNVTDTFSQSLAQSSAKTLPSNLAQATMQPSSMAGAQGAVPGAVGLPGSRTLLAVVRFGNGDTGLGNDDRTLLRRVAEYYKGTAGGNGSLAVVGFASSRTSDMEPSAHRQLNYSLSQKRAETVAAELRRRGVAADKVRAEARADAAPVYYEAMPRAEDYNRRVEIYLVN